MGAPGEKYIRLDVIKFPKFKLLKGHYKAKITPLDCFFYLGLGHYISASYAVHVDPKKVYISSMDAKVLYIMHRDFLMIVMGPEAGKRHAADTWEKFGPNVIKEVPKGFVFLEPGYLSID